MAHVLSSASYASWADPLGVYIYIISLKSSVFFIANLWRNFTFFALFPAILEATSHYI